MLTSAPPQVKTAALQNAANQDSMKETVSICGAVRSRFVVARSRFVAARSGLVAVRKIVDKICVHLCLILQSSPSIIIPLVV